MRQTRHLDGPDAHARRWTKSAPRSFRVHHPSQTNDGATREGGAVFVRQVAKGIA